MRVSMSYIPILLALFHRTVNAQQTKNCAGLEEGSKCSTANLELCCDDKSHKNFVWSCGPDKLLKFKTCDFEDRICKEDIELGTVKCLLPSCNPPPCPPQIPTHRSADKG